MISKHTFKFILFSTIGILLFLVPFTFHGELNFFTNHFAIFISNNFFIYIVYITNFLAFLILLLSFVFIFYTSKIDFLNSLFKSDMYSVIYRILGCFLYLIILNNWFSSNPFLNLFLHDYIRSSLVGNHGFITHLSLVFFITFFTIPFLISFGLVEYIGTLCNPFMRKYFNLPGYSIVNSITSLASEGSMGAIITSTQHSNGYFKRREAFLVATTFSIVGVPFAHTIAHHLELGHIFPIFYFTVLFVCFILGYVILQLPLKKFNTETFNSYRPIGYVKNNDLSSHKYALFLATNKARHTSLKSAFTSSLKELCITYVKLMPLVILFSSVILVIIEHTFLFQFISKPFIPIYFLLTNSLELAELIAISTLVSFFDLHLPIILISHVPSEPIKFFIGVLSLSQLIYFAESGMVLIKSSIGISFLDLLKTYLIRTFLAIPIIYLITRLFMFLNILT